MQFKLQKKLKKMIDEIDPNKIKILNEKIDTKKTIKIYISPEDNGFNLAIDINNSKSMNPEEFELVTTIARGLVYKATTDPHSTYLMGIKGFKNDREKRKDLKIIKTKKVEDNVIDFIDYLKKLQ